MGCWLRAKPVIIKINELFRSSFTMSKSDIKQHPPYRSNLGEPPGKAEDTHIYECDLYEYKGNHIAFAKLKVEKFAFYPIKSKLQSEALCIT